MRNCAKSPDNWSALNSQIERRPVTNPLRFRSGFAASLHLGLLFIASLCTTASGQTPLRPGRISAEEQAALVPGLKVRFEQGGEAGADARRARLAALAVAEGERPALRMEAYRAGGRGAFVARFAGYVKLPLRGDYSFQLEGRGARARLLINGEAVLDAAGDDFSKTPAAPVSLLKGYNRFELEYHSPAHGEALLRTLWTGEGFVTEPLRPEVLFTRGDDPDLQKGHDLRAARQLFAASHCLRCHVEPTFPTDGSLSTGMHELATRAPRLDNIGTRFQAEWLRAWLVDPVALRPQATMPRALGDPAEPATRQRAADVAEYLRTLPAVVAPPPAGPKANGRAGAPIGDLPRDGWSADFAEGRGLREEGDDLQALAASCGSSGGEAAPPNAAETAAGLKLFENLGCAACHHVKPVGAEEPFARRSLTRAAHKFTPRGLSEFLSRPHAYYEWSRMPGFQLTPSEVPPLAAFLSTHRQPLPAFATGDWPQGDAGRGKRLFLERGCAACHGTREATDVVPVAKALGHERLSEGCLSNKPGRDGKHPVYPFSSEQRVGLSRFVAESKATLAWEVPAEYSQRRVEFHQCQACHRRDGLGSQWSAVIDEEGSQGLPAEWLPVLTWTGEKLYGDWTERLFLGEVPHRSRPWLKARMPAFPLGARALVAGLAAEHGLFPEKRPAFATDPEKLRVGRQIAGDMPGFSCNKCHAQGEQKAIAPFEAPGINLADAAERLRPGYYSRWMWDPFRIDPAVKMPKFSPDLKSTPLTQIYHGDAATQFDVLWHHIQSLHREGK